MATVRVNEELLSQVREWIKKNGNKYQYSTVSAFVNSAIYAKLKEYGVEREY